MTEKARQATTNAGSVWILHNNQAFDARGAAMLITRLEDMNTSLQQDVECLTAKVDAMRIQSGGIIEEAVNAANTPPRERVAALESAIRERTQTYREAAALARADRDRAWREREACWLAVAAHLDAILEKPSGPVPTVTGTKSGTQ